MPRWIPRTKRSPVGLRKFRSARVRFAASAIIGVQKFYLHAAAPGAGTMPSASQSISAYVDSFTTDFVTQSMDATPGVAQTSKSRAFSSMLPAHLQGNMYAHASPPLVAQTIPAGSWTLSWAGDDANPTRFNAGFIVYAWRPSTGALVGLISDLGTTVAPGSVSEVPLTLTLAGNAVTVQDGDVLVIELFGKTASTFANGNIYYDGTVDGSSTDNAANLLAPVAIQLAPPTSITVSASDTATSSEAETIQQTRAAADAVTVAEAVSRASSRLVSDATTVADAASRSSTRGAADAVTVADSSSILSTRFLSFSDSVASSDVPTRVNVRSAADAVGATDASARSSLRTVADSSAVADATSRASARAVADTSSTTDAQTRRNIDVVGDSVTVADLAAVSEAVALTPSDAVTVTDSVSRHITLSFHDDVTVSDSSQIPSTGGEEPYVSVIPYGPAPFPRKGVKRLLLEFADSVAVTDSAEVTSVRKSVPTKKATPLYVSDILVVPQVAARDEGQELHDQVVDLLLAGVI